jgi:Tol biopolymer transport system component
MNRDGSGLRQLLNEYVTGVTWSPDGRKLLYKREAPSGPTGLFMVDVGGSAAPQPFIMDTDSLRVVGADWAR